MLYTKQLISGRDINMKEHLLGVIRQPIVDDFMGEYEFQDFLEVFYLEQTYNVEGLFGDMNKPFTYFLAIAYQEPKVLNSLNRALCLLYDINPKILYDEKFAKTHEDKIQLIDFGEGIYKIKIIKNNNTKGFAWIGDENFDYLSKVILNICYCDTPKPKKKEKYDTKDKDILKEFERQENKWKKKKEKEATVYEEIVREVIHMTGSTYNEIKNMTIFQLQDTYRTNLYIDAERKQWMMMTNPLYKVEGKNNKTWREETKISRD